MIRTMILAAGAMLASTAAQAQYAPHGPDRYPPQVDPYVPYRDVPPDYRVFGGLRVEARLSYDRLKLDLDEDQVFAPRHRTGLGFGGEIGYDLPLGQLVVGGYGGVEGTTIRECADVIDGGSLCIRPGRTFTAGGRIGVVAGGSTLIYAKGGYSNTRIGLHLVDPTNLPPFQDIRLHDNVDGYHLGFGVETSLSGSTYGKLEYVYTRLRGSGEDEDSLGLDFDRHQVNAGVGVRF